MVDLKKLLGRKRVELITMDEKLKRKQRATKKAKSVKSSEDNLRQRLKKLFKAEELTLHGRPSSSSSSSVKPQQQHKAATKHTMFNGKQKSQPYGPTYKEKSKVKQHGKQTATATATAMKPPNGQTGQQQKKSQQAQVNKTGKHNSNSKLTAMHKQSNAAKFKNKVDCKGKVKSMSQAASAKPVKTASGTTNTHATPKSDSVKKPQLKRAANSKMPTPQKKKLKAAQKKLAMCPEFISETDDSGNTADDDDDSVVEIPDVMSDSSEVYYNSADEDGSGAEEFSFEEEEDEDCYSDYDDDDYDEESDFFDYGEDDYTSDDGSGYDFESASNDEDYKLPPDVPEDLIVHRGTAETRALLEEDGVQFDSDNEEPQVVELSAQYTVKTILQPACYEKEALLKLNEKVEYHKRLQRIENRSEIVNDNLDSNSSTSECPELVPILDKDGFELYNPSSDYSDCSNAEEIDILSSGDETYSDESSIVEEDMISKYLPTEESSDDEGLRKTMKLMSPVVIYADDYDCGQSFQLNNGEIKKNESEDLPCEELLSQRLAKQMEGVGGHIVDGPVINVIELSNGTDLRDKVRPESVSQTQVDEVAMDAIDTELENTDDAAFEVEETQMSDNLAPTSASVAVTRQEFRSMFYNAIDSNHVLVLLKDPFYIYGTVRLMLIAGAIEVYGHQPHVGDEMEVFSPRGCSSVQIANIRQPISENTVLGDYFKKLKRYFSSAELQQLSSQYTPGEDAVILLRRNTERRKLISMFKKYMNENVFPNMNSIRTDRPLYASEYLLRCLINTSSEKALKVPQQWSSLELSAATRLMLVGGKSVGKSTMLRYLLNRHLQSCGRVLLIDLDIGQAEVFVPQTISCAVLSQPLLGPGFFLNQQPDKAYMIGQTNIVLCAHVYLRAVKQLLQYCQSNPQYAQLPWLVNTMGYNKGFGLELLAIISELLHPTDIVQLQSNKEINNFDVLLEPQILAAVPRNMYKSTEFRTSQQEPLQYRLHVLNAAVLQESRYQREWDMSPKDLRYAMLLARLSDALQGNAEWLTDCKPLSASLDNLKVIKLPVESSTAEELLNSIEANLVYLCHCGGNNGNEPLECFGIGVVRGIDYHIQQVYLLPAMPYERLNGVDCLALGEMPLPTSLFTNQGPKVQNVAPFVYNTIDAKASKSIKQIYHRPPEFLTGKHRDLTDT